MAGSPLPQAGEKPRDIKLNNRRIVLGAAGPGRDRATLGELAAESALSPQHRSKSASTFFLQKGLVADAGKGSSTSEGGKKPDMFALGPPLGAASRAFTAAGPNSPAGCMT